ncbi:MAG: DUF2267 domain-containing protein [Ardenticatenaceae bacterium]|nr:DUF2267 domain-containing protein [Ardenticatenaceae bacterium]
MIKEKLQKKQVQSVDDFYQYVMEHGHLRTVEHADLWSVGTLNMLGVNLSGRVKKQLGKALPEPLQKSLNGVFWVAHFRDTNMAAREFNNRVARRSRSTSDPDFARYPVQAVFGGLKALIDENVSSAVRDDLAPEISKMWQEA